VARGINKLTDRAVRTAKDPGWYGDGGGLYLRVDAAGSRRWVFVFQWRQKRAEMGLGALADVTLAEAREKRAAARKQVAAGVHPGEERRRQREAAMAASRPQTFGEWAAEIGPSIGPRAAKAQKAWVAMMTDKVGPLATLAPADIATDDVLDALKPYWVSRPESGNRMRQRIERVLDAAKAKGLIADPWQNPARWRGHLENLLTKPARQVKHFAALPFDQAPAFMARLRAQNRPAAPALEFTILTAVRNGEARGARAGEIDEAKAVWTIPAERMKGEGGKRREHRVPLSAEALGVLRRIYPSGLPKADALLFPSHSVSKTGMMSENALQGVLNDMGLQGVATVHGFRSTFRDWAGETTNFQREVIEAALAHVVGDDTERAYRRGDALAKRRKLMDAWAKYLAKPPAAGGG
jgi:integrase